MNSTTVLPFERHQISQHIRWLASSWLMWVTVEASVYAAAPIFPRLEWTREQRTSEDDFVRDVAADSLGNIFITGETYGPLSGSSHGLGDAFLSRYDSAGARKWTINIGSSNYDGGYGVSADNQGNAYVAGGINRLDFGGNRLYTQIFVHKYDVDGALTWSHSFGTNETDEARDVVVDGLGNVFLAGWTLGNLAGTNAGEADVFASKFNAQGDHLWTRQIGTNKFDRPYAAAADEFGNMYLAGVTTGDFGGSSKRPDGDLFVGENARMVFSSL